MKLLLAFATFVLQEEKAKHLPHIFTRWLRPYNDKYDVTSRVFPTLNNDYCDQNK